MKFLAAVILASLTTLCAFGQDFENPNPLLAQFQPNGPAVRVGRAPVRVGRQTAPKQPPCWQEAGISKSSMERRHAIEQETRARVESVCADPALNDQQKRQEIRQIRQQAHQEEQGLITPQQQQALRECQMARSKANPRPNLGGGLHARNNGPCE